jgi:hypothetical protein
MLVYLKIRFIFYFSRAAITGLQRFSLAIRILYSYMRLFHCILHKHLLSLFMGKLFYYSNIF